MSEHDDETRPIHTQAGTSDGVVGNGEPLSGRGTAEDQDKANDFYEEVGAAIQGREGDDVHGPDTGSVHGSTHPIETQAGTSDAIIGNGEHLSGKMGRDDQEEASDFFEEIGAAIQGKRGDDVHGPDMEE